VTHPGSGLNGVRRRRPLLPGGRSQRDIAPADAAAAAAATTAAACAAKNIRHNMRASMAEPRRSDVIVYATHPGFRVLNVDTYRQDLEMQTTASVTVAFRC